MDPKMLTQKQTFLKNKKEIRSLAWIRLWVNQKKKALK